MSKLISKDDFIKLFDNYDITISDSDYSRFEAYADLLCEWNEKINLTAITDPEGISIKHFFDSVYPFTLFEVKENATVIDVGTGAGFPSCPLKIVRDDIKLTLLEIFLHSFQTVLTLVQLVYMAEQRSLAEAWSAVNNLTLPQQERWQTSATYASIACLL